MKRVQKIFNGERLLLVMLVVVMLLAAAPAWGTTYFLYNQWGGTWQDANKTRVDDSLMCWAASAANILAWGKWTTPAYNTATTIFQDFKDHWTNGRGWQSWAWQWWLQGTPPPTTTYAYINVPGGGNYYPTTNFSSYYTSTSGSGEIAAMDQLMHQGYGISLVIGPNHTNQHAITAWGFDYALVNGQNTYTSVYVTDSDDGITALKDMGLAYSATDGWYFTSGYTNWDIMGVYAFLNINGTPVTISPSPSPTHGHGHGRHSAGVAGVAPISPTWLLVGTGLLLLVIMRTRRRNSASPLN